MMTLSSTATTRSQPPCSCRNASEREATEDKDLALEESALTPDTRSQKNSRRGYTAFSPPLNDHAVWIERLPATRLRQEGHGRENVDDLSLDFQRGVEEGLGRVVSPEEGASPAACPRMSRSASNWAMRASAASRMRLRSRPPMISSS